MHLYSFWWRTFKRSFKSAFEPFESIGRISTLFAGIVAIAFITNHITQEWGDYMIYWSIAVPVFVWLIWFFWNLIKIPHEIHEEELSSASSLPEITKKPGQNLAFFVFITLIVLFFVAILEIKTQQIAKLRKQINPVTATIAAKSPPPKALPETSVPKPESPLIAQINQSTGVTIKQNSDNNSVNVNGGNNQIVGTLIVDTKEKSRLLTQSAAQRIIDKLSLAKSKQSQVVLFVFQSDKKEPIDLQNQLLNIFMESGFSNCVKGTRFDMGQSFDGWTPEYISATVQSNTDERILDGLNQFFYEIGQIPQIRTNASDETVRGNYPFVRLDIPPIPDARR